MLNGMFSTIWHVQLSRFYGTCQDGSEKWLVRWPIFIHTGRDKGLCLGHGQAKRLCVPCNFQRVARQAVTGSSTRPGTRACGLTV
ncbi:hypothetical protein PVK06_005227 [Gossypium arboreum]|uniref:Uncharacterized protein n=1 Tax=Gossypium arboreum TaxID=29729 RepID=A0ABR0QUA2_GOSAR|nr:hypothetical protein PVK06_005227 [Gossypium arboreum]